MLFDIFQIKTATVLSQRCYSPCRAAKVTNRGLLPRIKSFIHECQRCCSLMTLFYFTISCCRSIVLPLRVEGHSERANVECSILPFSEDDLLHLACSHYICTIHRWIFCSCMLSKPKGFTLLAQSAVQLGAMQSCMPAGWRYARMLQTEQPVAASEFIYLAGLLLQDWVQRLHHEM